MTTALVSGDLHANKPAFQAVLEDADGADVLICTGDIVGILGWPAWTIETVREKFDQVVLGNHDCRVHPNYAYSPSFPAAQDEHRVVTEALDADHVEWLSNLPDRVETEEYILAHARPFYFRDPGHPHHGFAKDERGIMPKDFTTVGPHLDGKIALLGHTHEQHAVDMDKFPGQSGLIVNPGSVGATWYEPAEYALVDLEKQTYDLRSVEYDYDVVEDRLEEQGTPVGKYSDEQMRR